MGFTTQCFICKNTTSIRNRLKELGYYCNPYLGWHNLFTCVFGINSVYSLDDYDKNGLKGIDGLIDCGTNEELFLAIAALRDDTDKYQWFTMVIYGLNVVMKCVMKLLSIILMNTVEKSTRLP